MRIPPAATLSLAGGRRRRRRPRAHRLRRRPEHRRWRQRQRRVPVRRGRDAGRRLRRRLLRPDQPPDLRGPRRRARRLLPGHQPRGRQRRARRSRGRQGRSPTAPRSRCRTPRSSPSPRSRSARTRSPASTTSTSSRASPATTTCSSPARAAASRRSTTSRAPRQKITYGTTGVGTGAQLACALTFNVNKTPAEAIPFDGGAPALTALLGDQVDTACLQVGEAIENIKAGKIVPLSVFGPERVEFLPDVPTAQEQGLDVEVAQYRFMTVPKGTPQDVQDTIAEAMQTTFKTEGVPGLQRAEQPHADGDLR